MKIIDEMIDPYNPRWINSIEYILYEKNHSCNNIPCENCPFTWENNIYKRICILQQVQDLENFLLWYKDKIISINNKIKKLDI